MQADYVITWVDGQDAEHKAARKFYLEQSRDKKSGRLPNREEARHGFEQTTKIRFQDNGEIYYNIASVLKFAPFIRKIFVVTDNQTPPLLRSFIEEGKCEADFLQLVSHDEIFAADKAFPDLQAARPCFNSRSIESVLWRIPGLAEHFIFSNDDFFINAPLREENFFKDGAPRLYGKWESTAKMRIRAVLRAALEKMSLYQTPSSYSLSLRLGAKYAGGFTEKFLSIPHCPHALRKSVFAAFFTKNPQILNQQLQFRFRSPLQFNPVSLANHLEIAAGVPAEAGLNIAYLDEIKSPQHCAAVLEKIKSGAAQFGCIQDLGLYPIEAQAEIHHILIDRFRDYLPEAVQNHLLAQLQKAEAASRQAEN